MGTGDETSCDECGGAGSVYLPSVYSDGSEPCPSCQPKARLLHWTPNLVRLLIAAIVVLAWVTR